MSLSNTAVPKYYGAFREAVLRGDIFVNKEISMEMNRIDALIADRSFYYDDQAVEGWVRYCEAELTLTDGSNLNLLDTFTLRDNIFLPLVLGGKEYGEMQRRIQPIAEKLGIGKILEKYPYEVSGGQKQRAAVARALITNPQLVLADEPTGALDSRATDGLLDIFNDINQDGQTILMVTHSTKAASRAGRVMFIKDGEVFHQIYRGSSTNEQLYQKISDTLTLLAMGGGQA